ncbi:MAG: dTDP-4-dehydrorhamnose 3,5-epimerase [Deltaproteobacteria bacterium RIFCSPLOWO2_02_FULL_53_8]|nr:MAG: dTDP-4-dehydrorhamnose 3,5-epimerase [Deltaproteobacteria bacterium RIFCSPLOWO2_02_FULL_53_8]
MKLADILLTPLPRIETRGGDVLHAMKQSDAGYAGFGEAYFSWVAAGAVKGWKRHTRMTMNVVVPVGQVRFVFRLVNAVGAEEFRVEELGVERYARITVPPGFWFGFQGLAAPQSLVLNIASIPHDPNEVERLALSDINYVWN